ncbi:MAG: energy transducer TonB [Acetobacterales bacterium]
MAVSAAMHVAVITLAYVGLPALMSYEEPTNRPIIVDIVTLADKTNAPPPKPVKEAEAPEPRQAARPAPPPPAPAPAVAPEPELAPVRKPDPVPPPPEPVQRKVASLPPPPPEPQAKVKPKPEPEPEAKAPPKPAEKPQPPKPEPPKQAEKKPEPKEPEPPQQAEKKPEAATDFAQVLNSLNRIKERVAQREDEQEASAAPEPETRTSDSRVPHRPDQPLTVSELDFIRAQIQRCWIVPIGAKGIEDMNVEIRVEMNRDGSVRDASIQNMSRMQADPFFRTVAESARRAVLRCSPLRVPEKKFDQWQVMNLRFNPKDMFGS